MAIVSFESDIFYWEWKSPEPKSEFFQKKREEVGFMRYSPDNRYLAIGGGSELEIFDTQTEKAL